MTITRIGLFIFTLLALSLGFPQPGTSAGTFLKPDFASTVLVNTTEDELNSDGDCSLREAIQAANTGAAVDGCPAGDGIQLPAGTYGFTIPGAAEDQNASGDLDIHSNIRIDGAGARQTILDGNQQDRVFQIFSGSSVEINDLTISNGHAPDGAVVGQNGEDGGGIYNAGTLVLNRCTIDANSTGVGIMGGNGGNGGGIYNSGTLDLNQSTVSSNSSGGYENGGGFGGNGGAGGGIYNTSSLAVTNSTLSGNATGHGGPGIVAGIGGDGGGIYNLGPLMLDHSTISGNRTGLGGVGMGGWQNRSGYGGGIYQGSGIGQTSLRDTILSGNTIEASGPSECNGALQSFGYNLIQDTSSCSLTGDLTGNLTGMAARLLPLAYYGGNTMTLALQFNSPAIDAGTCLDLAGDLLGSDQRGISRPQGAACEIGAAEWKGTLEGMIFYLPWIMR